VPRKSAISPVISAPQAKISGIVREMKEWADATRQLDAGKSIEIKLESVVPLKSPINAFIAALKRKYRRKYHVYARNGVIYCVDRDTDRKKETKP
jgi:hypothetical protein